jgi:hypothetical protein
VRASFAARHAGPPIHFRGDGLRWGIGKLPGSARYTRPDGTADA